MIELVDLNSRRAPVVYTVTIAHHYDGKLEFRIEDVGDDERSREAVFHAFRRISGAEDRIEQLEAALRDCVNVLACFERPDFYQLEQTSPIKPYALGALDVARKALEGKDEQ
jgi:hypothetical protein